MKTIKTLTINETVQRLREHGLSIGSNILTLGIEQGVFPFGDSVRMVRRRPTVYEPLLDKWIAERTKDGKIKRLNINQCIAYLKERGLNIGPKILTAKLAQGMYPFGVIVQSKERESFIFESLLDKWLAERAVEVEEVS